MTYFERALGEIEAVRADLTAETHRAEFFGDKRGVYAAAMQTAADLHAGDPTAGHDAVAFELVQRAKARELLDALREEVGGRPLTHAELLAAARGAR